ncbi:MAG: hypothetical protein NW226_21510 [Microscillaceae bacterium]|nr:hypothetical protein [Microscillaceae bacterium]
MKLSTQEQNLFQAVAELAFAIAKADQEITQDEIDAYKEAIIETMGKAEWLAKEHFEQLLDNQTDDLESAYQKALQRIENNKEALDRVLIRKFLYVLEKVAKVRGIAHEEKEVINRFEEDVIQIHSKRSQDQSLKIGPELSNLYSTVGQLAYVIAMADHILMEEERMVFRQVIKTSLGDFDWLAEDRFKVIDEIMVLDLESTYEHALYLIQKNAKALDKSMIDKFLDVVVEVAKVAGITPEEKEIIDRFRRDIYQIYENKHLA